MKGDYIHEKTKLKPTTGWNSKAEKTALQKWWLWAIVVIVVLIATSKFGGDETNKETSDQQTKTSVKETSKDVQTVAPSEKASDDANVSSDSKSKITMGEKNALEQAKNYLEYSGFPAMV